MKTIQRLTLLLLAGATHLASLPVATAGVFSVTPVRIYMAPRDRAVAVTLVNENPNAVVLQADIHSWRQNADGSDEMELTDDLILSPPIVTLGQFAPEKSAGLLAELGAWHGEVPAGAVGTAGDGPLLAPDDLAGVHALLARLQAGR
mgnify:CR=1 FL=1